MGMAVLLGLMECMLVVDFWESYGCSYVQSTVDTNIWSAVVNVPAGPGPFHYTFLNSPSNGGDWGTKEDLSGLICGDPSNYNDDFYNYS